MYFDKFKEEIEAMKAALQAEQDALKAEAERCRGEIEKAVKAAEKAVEAENGKAYAEAQGKREVMAARVAQIENTAVAPATPEQIEDFRVRLEADYMEKMRSVADEMLECLNTLQRDVGTLEAITGEHEGVAVEFKRFAGFEKPENPGGGFAHDFWEVQSVKRRIDEGTSGAMGSVRLAIENLRGVVQ